MGKLQEDSLHDYAGQAVIYRTTLNAITAASEL